MEESSIAINYCRIRLSAKGQVLLALYVDKGASLAKWLLEFLGIPRNKGVNFHGKFALGIPRNS